MFARAQGRRGAIAEADTVHRATRCPLAGCREEVFSGRQNARGAKANSDRIWILVEIGVKRHSTANCCFWESDLSRDLADLCTVRKAVRLHKVLYHQQRRPIPVLRFMKTAYVAHFAA